jgi:tetratricopeptide (TPR) repeat protein
MIKEDNYEETIAKYTQAIALKPDDADAYFIRGKAFSARGEYEKAIEDFTKFIDTTPDSILYFYRSETYLNMGKYEEAMADYKKYMGGNCPDILIYNYFGEHFSSQRKYEEAIEAFTKAIDTDPGYADIYYNRGNALSCLERYKEAIEDYTKAIDIKSDYAEAYFNRGNAFSAQLKYEEAIANYNQAITLDPDVAEFYISRGDVFYKQRNHEKAISNYSKAKKLKPDYFKIYRKCGDVFLDQGKYKEAIANFTTVIAYKPNDDSIRNKRGLAYVRQGMYEAAITDFSKVINNDPENAFTYYHRGSTFADQRKYKEAIEDYNKAIELKPNLDDAYFNRGNAFFDQRSYNEAMTDYTKAIDINPDSDDAYNNRGIAFTIQETYEEAIADFKKAINIKPDDADAYFNLGNAFFDQGKYNEAIEVYTKAIDIKPNYAVVYHNRGNAFFRIERYKEAESDYGNAIEFDPSLSGRIFFDKLNNELSNLVLLKDDSKDFIELNDLVEKFLKERRCDDEEKGTHIYQYTTLNVVEIMREKKQLHLTPAVCQNDPEEGEIFFSYIKHSKKNNEKFKDFMEEIRNSHLNAVNTGDIAFIRSFSTLENDLTMWNSTYGENGSGAAVGILVGKLDKSTQNREGYKKPSRIISHDFLLVKQSKETIQPEKKEFPIKNLYLSKILYVNQNAENVNEEDILSKITNCLEKISRKLPPEKRQKLISLLSRQLTPLCYLVKDSHYAHEKEFRLHCMLPIENKYIINEGCDKGIYIETEPVLFKQGPGKEANDIIYLGPKVDDMMFIKCKLSFQKDGLPVEVKKSGIRFR